MACEQPSGFRAPDRRRPVKLGGMATEPEPSVAGPSFSNLEFVETLYFDYLANPDSVDPEWRPYFETLPRVAAKPAHPFPRRPDATMGGGNCDECAEAVHYETVQFRV